MGITNPNPSAKTLDPNSVKTFADLMKAGGGQLLVKLPDGSTRPLDTKFKVRDFVEPDPTEQIRRISLRIVGLATVLPFLFLVAVFGVLPLLRSALDFSLHNFPLVAVQSLFALWLG
jgi:hypothetical protein